MKGVSFFLLLTLLLPAGPLFAGGPKLPFHTPNACQGEDCWHRGWSAGKNFKLQSDRGLKVRDKPRSKKEAFVVPKGEAFSVVRHDLYTVKTSPVALRLKDHKSCPALGGRFHAKPGDTVYPLFYDGEGLFLVWHKGKTFLCNNPSKINEDSFEAETWVEVAYQGKQGWWQDPPKCSGEGPWGDCPAFAMVRPEEKELLQIARAYFGECDCKKREVSAETNETFWILTITDNGLLDDSEHATRTEVPLVLEGGRYRAGEKEDWIDPETGQSVKGAKVTRRCQPGRGHQDFSQVMCM